MSVLIVLDDIPGYPREDGVIPAVMGFRGVFKSVETFESYARQTYGDDVEFEDGVDTFGGLKVTYTAIVPALNFRRFYLVDAEVGTMNTSSIMDYAGGEA